MTPPNMPNRLGQASGTEKSYHKVETRTTTVDGKEITLVVTTLGNEPPPAKSRKPAES